VAQAKDAQGGMISMSCFAKDASLGAFRSFVKMFLQHGR